MSKEDASLEGHEIGVERCKGCCCSSEACDKDGCNGVFHSLGVIDEMVTEEDCYWIHEYLCDKCGEYRGY